MAALTLPSWLNPLDILIVFALLAGIAWGFVRGLVRMALNLAILYIATVLAMTFYPTVGRWLKMIAGSNLGKSITEVIAFVLILALTTAILHFIVSRTYKDTELPGVRQIDQLGGMLIGFVVISTWIGLTIVALAFILSATDTAISGLRDNLLMYFHNSRLIPIFYRFLPIVLATLRPWMPKGLPPDIFSFRLP
jgi:uncharacterized membrane protein required for colicin V production